MARIPFHPKSRRFRRCNLSTTVRKPRSCSVSAGILPTVEPPCTGSPDIPGPVSGLAQALPAPAPSGSSRIVHVGPVVLGAGLPMLKPLSGGKVYPSVVLKAIWSFAWLWSIVFRAAVSIVVIDIVIPTLANSDWTICRSVRSAGLEATIVVLNPFA